MQDSVEDAVVVIVLDVWGGHHSMDHMARFLRPMEESLRLAVVELSKGYLVNLRAEIAWGRYHEFDNRARPN